MPQLLRNVKELCAAAALLGTAIYPLPIHSADAEALAASSLTGTCGFAVSFQYPFAYLYPNPGPGWGMNQLGTINFDKHTIKANVVLQDPAGPASVEYQKSFQANFTKKTGPIPGSYTITFTYPGGDVQVFNLLPVNNGNTILMQGIVTTPGSQDGAIAGTCQR